jgi:hypothetical protein
MEIKRPAKKVANTRYAEIAGILLLIFGIGIPVISILVSILIALDPELGLIVLFTGPIIIIPLWVLPIIGGVFSIKRDHFVFALISSIIAFLYCIPLVFFINMAVSNGYGNPSLLYVPLILISLAAFALILMSRDEFDRPKTPDRRLPF